MGSCERYRTLHHQRIEILGWQSSKVFRRVAGQLLQIKIRRIAYNDIEATAVEDAVELNEPMERLVRLYPLGVRDFVAHLHTVFASEVPVEFVFQSPQPFLKF